MKKTTRLLAMLMAMMILFTQPLAFAATTKSKYTSKTYTHQSRFDNCTVLNGIDVSEHNGSSINFKKVKADGIDFVIVRVGWTGYTRSRHSLNYDLYYKDNIKNALSNGLAVGVYWYSQALTTAEAIAEADMLTSVISGYDITLPVVMDYEFADVETGRLDYAWKNKQITKTAMTKNALAFLDRVNQAGYDACIYANRYFLYNNVDGASLDDSYSVWLADYSTNTPYENEFDFWQYSSSGKVSGISGNVDMNFWYFSDQPNSTDNVLDQEYIYTGKSIEPTVAIYEDDTVLSEGTDYTLAYSNNVKIGYATITATGIGDYDGKNWKFKFKIVPERPTGLVLTQRTTESLTFKWKSVKGAEKYYLTIRNKTKGTVFSKVVTSTSTTLNGLTPANNYSVTVKAGNKAETVWGAQSVANTKHTIPDAVTGLSVLSKTQSSIRLKWDKKAGCSGYRISKYVASKDKYYVVKELSGADKTTCTIKDLPASTAYNYTVSAYVTDSVTRYGAKSKMIKAATRPVAVKLSSAKSNASNKITVTFPKIKASGYQVQWSTTKNFSSNYLSVRFTSSAQTVHKTITTAQNRRYYFVRVRAYKNVDGKRIYGNWSETKKVMVK